MLKNAYLLAKIGADTAENERNFAENLPKIGNYPTLVADRQRRAEAERQDLPGLRRRTIFASTATNFFGGETREGGEVVFRPTYLSVTKSQLQVIFQQDHVQD